MSSGLSLERDPDEIVIADIDGIRDFWGVQPETMFKMLEGGIPVVDLDDALEFRYLFSDALFGDKNHPGGAEAQLSVDALVLGYQTFGEELFDMTEIVETIVMRIEDNCEWQDMRWRRRYTLALEELCKGRRVRDEEKFDLDEIWL